jgi:DNA gyrase subunit A
MGIPIPELDDGLYGEARLLLKAAMGIAREKRRAPAWTHKVIKAVWTREPSISPLELYAMLLSMTQEWVCRYPLFVTQGNFGSLDGDPPAAMRYNQVGLSPFGVSLATSGPRWTKRKRNVPSFFPHLLVNGAYAHSGEIRTDAEPGEQADPVYMEPLVSSVPTGGYQGGQTLSFLPPHNLGEIARTLLHLLDHPEASFGELMEMVPGPDFPTGGCVLADEGLKRLYHEGAGTVVVRARATTEPASSGKSLIAISELPYTATKAQVMEEIAVRAKSGEHGWISDVRDMSSRESMRIEIEVRRGYDAPRLLQTILRQPPLEKRLEFMLKVRDGAVERMFPFFELVRVTLDRRRAVSNRGGERALRSELKRLLEWSDRRRTQLVIPT